MISWLINAECSLYPSESEGGKTEETVSDVSKSIESRIPGDYFCIVYRKYNDVKKYKFWMSYFLTV